MAVASVATEVYVRRQGSHDRSGTPGPSLGRRPSGRRTFRGLGHAGASLAGQTPPTALAETFRPYDVGTRPVSPLHTGPLPRWEA